MVFDVSDTVPLLSTKKVNVEAVMEELLFFIRGDTDTRKLEAVGVNIWKENTSKQFMEKIGLKNIPIKFMGPMYGYQWRHFNAPYNPNNDANIGGIDQLADVIHLLKTDPYSRRIMMTTYNPSQAREGVLYPCHGIITQFFIEDNGSLSCQTYQRSADFCVGVPFNMASYGILIHIIAHIVDRKPGRLIMIFGDTHMYSKHDSLANVQLSRETMMYPECKFRISAECPKNIDSVKREHLIVENYKSHPYIPYQFIA
jgi:thymidylate synthase